MLWPRGVSFCRDQSKSFRLLLRSTYWHIQMPSVYCENRSIGWNNTVAGDNVLVRDALWSSFGFTDSGAFMCPPPPATAITITLRTPHPPHPTDMGLSLSFSFLLVSSTAPPPHGRFSSFLTFPSHLHLCSLSCAIPTSTTHTSFLRRLPCLPYEPPSFTPPHPPAACLS